jgi:formamidopyrimidine-DNA glycosylase
MRQYITNLRHFGKLDAGSSRSCPPALAQGGTSFDALYVNVNGESGYFDRSLHAYGQEGRPCDRCGTPIRRVQFMNRSSYFCPRCQPAPRSTAR